MPNYIKQEKVTGGDIQVEPTASTGTSFLNSFLGNIMEGKSQEEKMKKEQDKLTYYKTLREAGYSAEEASGRVKKQFSGSFLEKVLNRNKQGFETPADPEADPFKAELESKKSETRLKESKAGYYEQGGPKRTIIDKFTPAQLREYRNDLLDPMKNPDAYDAEETRAEVAQIDAKLKSMAGLESGTTESATAQTGGIKLPDAANYAEGTTLIHQKTQKKFIKQNGKWTNG